MICETLQQLDIRDLRKRLRQDLPDEFEILGQTIRTTKTDCHLGGQRQWFLCPGCSRRCAILYPKRCRTCVGARYQTEYVTVEKRREIKAMKLRRSLGQTEGGLLSPFPYKPKGMHQRTYDKLRREARALEAEIWRDLARFLERLTGRTG